VFAFARATDLTMTNYEDDNYDDYMMIKYDDIAHEKNSKNLKSYNKVLLFLHYIDI